MTDTSPPIPLPTGYEADLAAALHLAGWVAEWEPGQQDDDEGPVRYVKGCLTLTYGVMTLSRHPTLDLSIHGLSGTWTSVDLHDTPAADVPEKVQRFARSCVEHCIPYMQSAIDELGLCPPSVGVLAEVNTERQRQIGKGYDAAHDDEATEGQLYETAAVVLLGHKSVSGALLETRAAADYILNKWADNRRRQLLIAAALIVAEIERLDRIAT